MTQTIDKHPSWFKLKLERRQLIRELPPESAVRVLLSCLNYLEAGRFPETLSPIEKIAVSAFLPDLEEAVSTYAQRVKNGAKGGAPRSNKNARKKKQPYASSCAHLEPHGTEEEADTPYGVDASGEERNGSHGEAALVGGSPARFYYDPAQGKVIDREETLQ